MDGLNLNTNLSYDESNSSNESSNNTGSSSSNVPSELHSLKKGKGRLSNVQKRLESDFNPDYLKFGTSTTDVRSRYGRAQKVLNHSEESTTNNNEKHVDLIQPEKSDTQVQERKIALKSTEIIDKLFYENRKTALLSRSRLISKYRCLAQTNNAQSAILLRHSAMWGNKDEDSNKILTNSMNRSLNDIENRKQNSGNKNRRKTFSAPATKFSDKLHETFIQNSQTDGLSITNNISTYSIFKEEVLASTLVDDEWSEGDIAWGRVGKHPFWPCLICPDPTTGSFVKISASAARTTTPPKYFHVRFFADNGRRSELRSHCLFPFTSVEDFKKRADEITPDLRKKNPKYCTAFNVPPSKLVNWENAIEEAKVVMKRPKIHRLDYFDSILPEWLNCGNKMSQNESDSKSRNMNMAIYNHIKSNNAKNRNQLTTNQIFNNLMVDSKKTSPIKYDSQSVQKNEIEKGINEVACKKLKLKLNNSDDISNMGPTATDITVFEKHEMKMSNDKDHRITTRKRSWIQSENNGLLFNINKFDYHSKICKDLEKAKDSLSTCSENFNEETEVKSNITEKILNNNISPLSTKTLPTDSRKKKNLRKKDYISESIETQNGKQNLKFKVKECPIPNATNRQIVAANDFHKSEISARGTEKKMNGAKQMYESSEDVVNRCNGSEQLIRTTFTEMSTEMEDSKNAVNDKPEIHTETRIKTRRSSRYHENGFIKEIELTKFNNTNDELNDKKTNGLISSIEQDTSSKQTNSKAILEDEAMKEAEGLKKMSHKISKSESLENGYSIDQNENTATNRTDSGFNTATSISGRKNRSSRYTASSEQDNLMNIDEYHSEKSKIVSANNMHNKVQLRRRSIRTGSSDNGVSNLDNAPVNMLNNVKHRNLDDLRCKSDMSDNSDSVTESSKNEPHRKLKQNLFRGLSRERVCTICEKPGNLLKCKGLCSNYYHYSCAFPTNVNGSTVDKYNSTTVDMNVFEKHAQTQMLELLQIGSHLYSSGSSSENEMADDEVGCKIVEVGRRRRSQNSKGPSTHSTNFKCKDCSNNRKPNCFICHKVEYCEKDTEHNDRHKCCVSQCGNFFHVECLKEFPQTKINSGSTLRSNKSTDVLVDTFTCPHHVCHTCVSDNPRGNKSRFLNDKLSKCIKCPTSYHTSIHCIPAGTVLLTSSQIICTKHFNFCKKSKTGLVQHLNVSWCFICSVGGSLICCETCPTAFHIECLGLSQPEGGYICEDCESGRFPLYDEVVWCKLGSFRWWPARVLPPYEIPQKIHDIKHEPGGFCVRFFGSFDHHWTNRRRVFLYHEGDTAHTKSNRKSLDGMFIKAVLEAGVAYAEFKRIKEMHAAKIEGDLMPPYYIKIKTNRIVGNVKPADGDLLSVTPCECNPNTDEPCGPESTCLNRMLLFECDPSICPAGDRCCNQSFEKRLYPPLTPYKTKGRGWGLKTLANIKCGQFVIEYVGDVIDDAEFKRRLERKHQEKDENYYFLVLDKDRMIDAGPKGNMARFMNHSCDPNCETQKWFINGDIRVGLFAIQDILADTELTFNYNLESTGGEKKKCYCGASKCSGYIGAKAKPETNTNPNPNPNPRANKKQSKKKKG